VVFFFHFQEKAIMAVGSIVANYSTDQFFPVFGFGGNPPGSDVCREEKERKDNFLKVKSIRKKKPV
jgi:hypothetical protein